MSDKPATCPKGHKFPRYVEGTAQQSTWKCDWCVGDDRIFSVPKASAIPAPTKDAKRDAAQELCDEYVGNQGELEDFRARDLSKAIHEAYALGRAAGMEEAKNEADIEEKRCLVEMDATCKNFEKKIWRAKSVTCNTLASAIRAAKEGK